MPFPTYVPIQGATPDLPATDAGLEAGYFTYPGNRVKAVQDVPGLGSDVSVVTSITGAAPPALDQNPAWQAANKALNANMKVQVVASNDYPTRLATIMAGNDLPDLLYLISSTYFSVPGMPQFLEASYADLTPYLSGDAIKDYPNLAGFPSTAWTQTVINGAIRGVPVSRPCLQAVWFVNQTRLDAIGAAHPTNGDEFKRLLVELNNPQQNQWGMGAQGPTFGVLYNGHGDCPQAAMFGVPNNWAVDSNGKFTRDVETEQFKAALSYVRDLYTAGVFYPDPTLTATTLKLNFAAGKYAVMYQGWAVYPAEVWDAGLKQTPPVVFRTMAPFSNDGSTPIWHRYGLNHGITAIKKASAERIRELLRILNYLASPFGSHEELLTHYGVEGVDFNFDAKGNPVPTDKGLADLNVSWRYLADRPQVLFDPNDVNFAKQAYTEMQTMVPYLVADPTIGLYSATDASKGGPLTQNILDRVADMVTGRSPLNALDQLLNDWRSAGGDQIRAEYEQAYADSQK
ncbi:MAG: extracellular solute-binding protein [Chloroflexi bacterium]|nr:extracellular solute-binding protein [Chloroflexota bacterium]MBV9596842.1 extracellular solute-binding protein [Chloroflexota bacterium]